MKGKEHKKFNIKAGKIQLTAGSIPHEQQEGPKLLSTRQQLCLSDRLASEHS